MRLKNNFEKLAYDVSKNLIDSIDPSSELAEYSIILARAHIFNKKFELAEKWISFSENHVLPSNNLEVEQLNNVKFLYDLQKSEDNNIFIQALEKNLRDIIEEKGTVSGYTETLKTVYSSILNQKDLIEKIEDEKKIFDMRVMPSRYIISKIESSSVDNKIGELILSSLVSLNDKSWNDVHPQHLKILLDSFRNKNLSKLFEEKLDKLFKNIIIEIFEENKLI